MDKLSIRIVFLGALVGLMASVLVILFRLSIELLQVGWLPGGVVGNYEALPDWLHFALPLGGALLLGLAFNYLPPPMRAVGVVHVLEFLRFRKQRLPFRNALVQFAGGWLAIISGQSVDREGPGVHLGAANAALLGRRFKLQEDEDYLLAAAGGAAAIAAAYNTPLAGVIFVIEVFRLRYAINAIVPVIVATVMGAVISQLVFGSNPAFDVPPLSIGSLAELPVIAGMGLLIGLLASLFILMINRIARFTIEWQPLVMFPVAGLVTGILALWAPAIMGISYDALNRIFQQQLGFQALALLLFAKFVATAVSVGARMPGGLIGPSLMLGGAVGGIIEYLVAGQWSSFQGSAGFYALTGMVAMMGAVLHAPLAALVALMELTGNLNIILPGMIVVVSAEVVTRSLIGDQSAFTTLLVVKHEREARQMAAQAQLVAEAAARKAETDTSEKQDG